jgi:hypothetical protein
MKTIILAAILCCGGAMAQSNAHISGAGTASAESDGWNMEADK